MISLSGRGRAYRRRWASQQARRELEERVFFALGEASVCWEEPPDSQFDSDAALEVGRELLGYLETTFGL